MKSGRKIFEVVELSPYFNNDGISYRHNRMDGDLDGEGMTFPAEELPESCAIVTLCGIDFFFPDKRDGALNNLFLEGQLIAIPPNQYSVLHVLGVSEGGSFEDKIAFQYTDGGEERVMLGLTNCRLPWGEVKFGEQRPLLFAEMHFPPGDWHTSSDHPTCGLWLQSLAIDSARKLRAIQLADNPAMHLFAMTLQRA
jgi:hypothetical protein